MIQPKGAVSYYVLHIEKCIKPVTGQYKQINKTKQKGKKEKKWDS